MIKSCINNVNGLFDHSKSTIGIDFKKYEEEKINKEIIKERKIITDNYKKWCKKNKRKPTFTKDVKNLINKNAKSVVRKRNGYYKNLSKLSLNNIKNNTFNNDYLRSMYINSYEKNKISKDIRKHYLRNKSNTLKIYFHNLYMSMFNISKSLDKIKDLHNISMLSSGYGLTLDLLHGIRKYSED